jgi:hypothetical protein
MPNTPIHAFLNILFVVIINLVFFCAHVNEPQGGINIVQLILAKYGIDFFHAIIEK